MQPNANTKLTFLAVIAMGVLLQSTPVHADIMKTRCDADLLTPAAARLRLEWARACGAKINVVSPTAPVFPAEAYLTGTNDAAGIPLWEYIENNDFWGRNSYSGDSGAGINQMFAQNQWRTGPYVATTAAGGFQKWTESSTLALARPTYPIFGNSTDINSGTPLFPNPNYSLLDCKFYTNQAATIVADTSTTGFYVNGYCPSSDIPTSALHLWLRADQGVTTSGGFVSRWIDQSGNGRNASMATTAQRPSYVTNAFHGLSMLRFNGTQSMTLDIFAQPTTFTLFVVGKNNTPTETFSMILGPAGNSPNNQLRWDNGSSAMFVGIGNNMPVISSPIGNTRVYHELSASYTGAAMTVYRDGTAISTSSFATTGPWTLASLGSYYATYFMNGDLAEVIIYDRVLSAAERAYVDTYIRNKYFVYCGNAVCDGGETSSTCSSDCSVCGDGLCSASEDAWSCPGDCSVCGDGICSGFETPTSCSVDCGSTCGCTSCIITPCLACTTALICPLEEQVQ